MNTHSCRLALVPTALLTFLVAGSIRAQCTNPWLSAGANGNVLHLAAATNGSLIAAGAFTSIAGVSANRIASYDGVTWSSLGIGVSSTVDAALRRANGTVLASQQFGGDSTFVSWNGSTWTGVGDPGYGRFTTMAELPNGHVVAGGGDFLFGGGLVARWNGTSWSFIGSTNSTTDVRAVVAMPNGDVVAGGEFTAMDGVPATNIARWNGTSWAPVGAGLPGVLVAALIVAANGDLLASGSQAGPVFYVARWNGSTWTMLGGSLPATAIALAELPNGDIVATGTDPLFSAAYVKRWNGTAWLNLATTIPGLVDSLAMMPSGQLLIGGNFISVDGVPTTNRLARLTTTCPATAVASGLGCPSSGGSNTLVADVPPWVDATFRATGTGLPTTALVLTLTSVTSFAQGLLPLTLVFSQAGPGCDALVAPDILGLLVTTTGSAQSSFFLPNTPPLVGVTFYHQMIPIELDMVGAWVAVTATHALQLTAGTF